MLQHIERIRTSLVKMPSRLVVLLLGLTVLQGQICLGTEDSVPRCLKRALRVSYYGGRRKDYY